MRELGATFAAAGNRHGDLCTSEPHKTEKTDVSMAQARLCVLEPLLGAGSPSPLQASVLRALHAAHSA